MDKKKGENIPRFNKSRIEDRLKSQSVVDGNSEPKSDNPFTFQQPLEAPTFRPTKEDFADPVYYINSIKPLAEQYGMCKIVPPEGNLFPFTLPVDKFKFTTRSQNLGRFDELVKYKTIFLSRLSKFFELRGSVLSVPIVESQKLDLYILHRAVASEGGYIRVQGFVDKWIKVAVRLNYKEPESIAPLLEEHYKNLILPYVMVVQGGNKDPSPSIQTRKRVAATLETIVEDEEEKSARNLEKSKEAQQPSKRTKNANTTPKALTSRPVGRNLRSSTLAKETASKKLEQLQSSSGRQQTDLKCKTDRKPAHTSTSDSQPCTRELRVRLEVLNPPQTGSEPRSNGRKADSKTQESKSNTVGAACKPEHVFKVPYPVSQTATRRRTALQNELRRLQISNVATLDQTSQGCQSCQKTIPDVLLSCNNCQKRYHATCIVPVLREIPKGKWNCTPCITKELKKEEVEKPMPFDDGRRFYSLREFQYKSMAFKRNYLRKMNIDEVMESINPEILETEYWKKLSQRNKTFDTVVEYGSNISGKNGTGFPTADTVIYEKNPQHRTSYQRFVDHPWNLNNILASDGSVLKYINSSITESWMDIGMLFSTSHWRLEDHWCYSISTLHFGDRKTVYAVPGSHAEKFENVVKEIAPELNADTDILQVLCTAINPNKLMDKEIPVYRLHQNEGEYVVTFPRAYHSHFNHGFNFTESIHFGPPDWIEFGRKCIEHYSLTKRHCLFSQDEMIFKIASNASKLDKIIASAAYQDLYCAVHSEFKLREQLKGPWGCIKDDIKFQPELLSTDARQCSYCCTTVFLSAIYCKCSTEKMVCIKHYDKLCSTCKPNEHHLKTKYTPEEIFVIFRGLLEVMRPYVKWFKAVQLILLIEPTKRGFKVLPFLKDMLKEAEINMYPNTPVLKKLVKCVREAEQMNDFSTQFLSALEQTDSTDEEVEEIERTPNFTDLVDFMELIGTRDLRFFDDQGIHKYIEDVKEWKCKVDAAIKSDALNSKEIESIRDEGVRFNLNFPEIDVLDRYLERLKWREELASLMEKPLTLTKKVLQEHKDKGLTLKHENDSKVEQGISAIENLMDEISTWEEKAQLLISVSKPTPESLLELLKAGEEIKAHLPSRTAVESILEAGQKWVEKVRAANNLKNGPYVEVYEDLLSQAHKLNLNLADLTEQIRIQLESVRIWKEKASSTFIKHNSLTLMEALAPRTDIGSKSTRRKKFNHVVKNIIHGVKLSGDTDPGVVVAAFKKAEKHEFDQMLQFRLENGRKRMDIDAKYCICKKNEAGIMVECSLCKEKFHDPCLQMGIESDMSGSELAEIKFLCSTCVRTKRPKLDILVELVQSMHMIKVRIPEGEALQRLTERAMNWQDRVRKLLNTPEMSTALHRLNVPLPPSIAKSISRPAPSSYERTASSTVTSSMLIPQAGPSQMGGFIRIEPTKESSIVIMADHVYSTMSRKPVPPKKHSRKSPLIPRVLEEPPRMSESGFRQLKELMIQGDLMEVFVEEATCIWKLLQTFKQTYFNIWDDGYEEFIKYQAEKAAAEAAASKPEKQLSALERFFMDKPEPPVKRPVKVPRKTMSKKTTTPKPTKTTEKLETKQTKRKPKTSTPTGRPAKRAKKSKKLQEDDDENDDNSCEDDCAAEPCRRPTGSALHWVQCDGGCDLWFHLHCIGLSKHDIAADQDYICDKCS